MSTFIKDPQAVLDYAVDWSTWAGTDTPVTATWQVTPTGLTIASTVLAGDIATVWLSGGTAGTAHTVTCHVTTAEGREDDRSIRIIIEDR